jgi:hypothetical protein
VAVQPAQQARTDARQGIKRRQAAKIAVRFPLVDDPARQIRTDTWQSGNFGGGRAVEVDQLTVLERLPRETRAVPVRQW